MYPVRIGSPRRRESGLSVDSVGTSVGLYLEEGAVEADHLSVESVERAQSEISTIPEFSEADVALVLSLQQGIDGRSLEQRMVEVLVSLRSRSLRYSTCSAPINAVSIGIRLFSLS